MRIMIRQATKNETIELQDGGVANLAFPTSKTKRGRVQHGGECSPTLTTEQQICQVSLDEGKVKIRRLTPKECWRLMDFDDDDFAKASSVNSDTQLYKQAGNSIVVNVLVAIFGQLFKDKEQIYRRHI